MSLSIEDITFELMVLAKIDETPSACSFVFEIPENLKSKFHYEAGQFVSVFMNIQGEQIVRSYSLGSAPIPDEPFKITVKRVPGGKGSNFLCDQVKVGDKLKLSPPSGHFFKPKTASKNFALYGAGSGITPLFSILKKVLLTEKESQVYLVYANRSEDQIIYFNELSQWEANYPGRLHVTHLLSQPGPTWSKPTSRCNEQWLADFWNKLPQDAEHYTCGPDAFMSMIEAQSRHANVPASQFHKESFTTTKSPKLISTDGLTVIGKTPAEDIETSQVSVTLNGETKIFTVKKDESILEALLEAGESPPYSCMDGTCMACMGRITAGCVIQEDPGILTDENIEIGECLTCQAKPRSEKVDLNYDIF